MSKITSLVNKMMKDYGEAMPDVKEAGIVKKIALDSPNMNYVLGGGLPRGRILTLLGQESGGKSVLASYIGGQIQKQKDVPNVVVYVDMEHTFDRDYASVVGLDTEDDSKFIFVRPKHGEEGFEIVKVLAESGEMGLVIWDSVAATPSAKVLAKDVGSASFGATAAVMSEGLKIVNPILSRHNVPTIFINQVRCIEKNTFININGVLKPIKDIKKGDIIFDRKVLNVVDSGIIKGKKIHVKYRPDFLISDNHLQPIINEEGYVTKLGSEIKEGDWLIQPIIKNYSNSSTYLDISEIAKEAQELLSDQKKDEQFLSILNEDLAFILGMYYSDGSIRNYNKSNFGLSWTERNKERYNLVLSSLQKMFNHVNTHGKHGITLLGQAYLSYFENLGCKRYGKNKIIPELILQSPDSVIKAFIRGAFFDTHAVSSKGFIFTNENQYSLRQFSTLLYNYGIFGDIRKNHMYFTGDDSYRFNSIIGFAEETKKKKSESFKESSNARGKFDIVPYSLGMNIISYLKSNTKKNISGFVNYNSINMCIYKKFNFCRKTLIDFINYCEVEYSSNCNLIRDNRFSIIEKIESQEIDAIDIEVNEDSLFIADQYLTHNSKIGGMPSFGPQDNTKVGGYALPFYSSWIAKVSRIEDIVDKKEIIGMTMKVRNTKSKIGLPKRSVNLDLYYRTGFNPDMEYINFIIEMGYVQKSGAWLSNEEWGMKVQGRNGLLDYMKKNEDKYDFLKKEINDSFSKFTVLDSAVDEEDENSEEMFLEE